MSLPGASQILSYYLYGYKVPPSDKTTETLIRDGSQAIDQYDTREAAGDVTIPHDFARLGVEVFETIAVTRQTMLAFPVRHDSVRIGSDLESRWAQWDSIGILVTWRRAAACGALRGG